MKKLLILPIIAISALCSCVEDEGNYSYTELNKVQVDSIREEYQVLAYLDTLRISPEISGSVNGEELDNYEYQWYLCQSTAHEHIVISTEKDLEWEADVYPGTHTLYFVVKDKETGFETIMNTKVKASSPFTRGFLLFGDRSGSDLLALDMLSMVPGRDTAYVENVLDNSTLQLKNAKRLDFLNTGRLTMWFMSAGDKTYRLSLTDSVEIFGELNELGYITTAIPHKNPMKLAHVAPGASPVTVMSTAHSTFITDDLAFSRQLSADIISFTQPFNHYVDGKIDDYFRPYPYVFGGRPNSSYPNNMAWPPILYDLDGECFVYASAVAATDILPTICRSFQDLPYNEMKFNNKALGRTVVYGENDYSQSTGFSNALMGDVYGNFYVYRFRQSNATAAGSTSRGVAPTMTTYCYNVNSALATDLDKATHYHFATNTTALIYSVGNTLYEYDYVNGRETNANASQYFASMEFDGEITYIAPDFRSVKNDYSQYLVATYDGTKGKIYKLQVTNNPNKIEIVKLDNFYWEVDMKVTSIVWKEN